MRGGSGLGALSNHLGIPICIAPVWPYLYQLPIWLAGSSGWSRACLFSECISCWHLGSLKTQCQVAVDLPGTLHKCGFSWTTTSQFCVGVAATTQCILLCPGSRPDKAGEICLDLQVWGTKGDVGDYSPRLSASCGSLSFTSSCLRKEKQCVMGALVKEERQGPDSGAHL